MSPPSGLVPSGTAPLTRERKAAMIVQMLLADGRRLPLDRLPDNVQLKLTRELAQLRLVDKGTVDAVASEFIEALDSVGMAAPGSAEAALRALEGHISEEAMARLRIEVGVGVADPWPAIVEQSKDTLLKIMDSEATEVAAVVLSKLPTARAADLLAALPGADARRIALAVSRTQRISPTTVHSIGVALVKDYVSTRVGAFAAAPAPRVGAILNVASTDTREDLLAGLTEEDPKFAEEVRRAIFTFEDIPHRVQPADLPKVLRLIDNSDLITALIAGSAGSEAGAAAAEFMLDNMSKRMAESLREEMAERGKVKKSEGEAAMASVVTAIRDTAERGEITLIDPDGEEE